MSKTYSAYDVQKHKLDRLMSNPEKPVHIPESRKDGRKFPDAPEFVRNIMGSSAGAGSGEFHVYRHLRRKEYARQKFIKDQAEQDVRDTQFKERLEQKRKEAEERTDKKRLKRLKKKKKNKGKPFPPKQNQQQQVKEEDDDGDEEGDEEEGEGEKATGDERLRDGNKAEEEEKDNETRTMELTTTITGIEHHHGQDHSSKQTERSSATTADG